MDEWLRDTKENAKNVGKGLYSMLALTGAIVGLPVIACFAAYDKSKRKNENKEELRTLFEIEMEEAYQEAERGHIG